MSFKEFTPSIIIKLIDIKNEQNIVFDVVNHVEILIGGGLSAARDTLGKKQRK